MRSSSIIFVVIMFSALIHCSSTTTRTDGRGSSSSGSMTPSEARQIIDQLMARQGLAPNKTTPTSIEEVRNIYQSDEIARFGPALEFVKGKSGVDAWTLRASLELSWGGMQLILSKILENLVERKSIEISVIESKSGSSGGSDEAETAELEELRAETAELNRTIRALKVLAVGHVEAGGELVNAVIDRNPDNAKAYLLKAHYHRLTRDWELFDVAARHADTMGGQELILSKLLRAMEKLQRFDSKAEAREQLQAIRIEAPDFIRAQAVLALIQDDIEATHAELTKLRALTPNHPVIFVAGPELEEEYETSMSLRAE